MDNLTFIDILLNASWPGNASVMHWENVSSYFLTQGQNQLFIEFAALVVVKNAFVCWFIKEVIERTHVFTMQYDLLLLVICYHSAFGKVLDVCGLSFVWLCYLLLLNSVNFSVGLGCMILFVATLLLPGLAPSYFFLLVFTVDILFAYTMFCYIIAINRILRIYLLHFAMTVLTIPYLYALIHGNPGPNMDNVSLMKLMLAPMFCIALEKGREYLRAIIVAFTIGYCIYEKLNQHSVTDLEKSS